MIYRQATPVFHEPAAKGGDLAVITCHFNWPGFARPRQNLRRFLIQMDAANVPVYGVEALLGGQDSITSSNPNWTQVPVSHHGVMFQKEALLNAAEKLVPPQYSKIAWVDADVWFDNPLWPQITSALLDASPVVQPFSLAVWMDRFGAPQHRLPGAVHTRSSDPCVGHPGFAMAARRELWSVDGLYDGAITGQGDIIFFCGVSKNPLRCTDLKGLGSNHLPYYRWRDRMRQWFDDSGGTLLATPGTVYHEWHGDRDARGYVSRHEPIRDFDRDTHVTLQPGGWLQWTNTAPPAMMAGVAGYFQGRKEDG